MAPKVTAPLLASVVLHAALLLAMVLNLSWASERRVVPPQPAVIQATLIKMEAQAPERAETVQAPAKPAPRPEPQPVPEPAAAPVPAPDRARQQAEAEKKREQAQQAALKSKAEEERERDAELERRAEAERKRRAEEERKRAEAERKRKLAEEARQREAEQKRREAQAREELARAMAAEEQRMAAQQQGALASRAADVIRTMVERSWSRPPSARTGMVTTLRIQMIRRGDVGEVVGVSVTNGSGNAEFDQSAVNAVRRVGEFPMPQDLSPTAFRRNFASFELVFKPQDLRL